MTQREGSVLTRRAVRLGNFISIGGFASREALCFDKGKPVVRRGRKATGPAHRCRMAELPKHPATAAEFFDCDPRARAQPC